MASYLVAGFSKNLKFRDDVFHINGENLAAESIRIEDAVKPFSTSMHTASTFNDREEAEAFAAMRNAEFKADGKYLTKFEATHTDREYRTYLARKIREGKAVPETPESKKAAWKEAHEARAAYYNLTDQRREGYANEEAHTYMQGDKEYLFMSGRRGAKVCPENPDHAYPNMKFEVTDHIPDGYKIYCDCRRLPNGYLPLAKMNGDKADKNTLKVIRVPGAERFVKLNMETVDEMRQYVIYHAGATYESRVYETVRLARDAVLHLQDFEHTPEPEYMEERPEYRYAGCFSKDSGNADTYHMDLHIYDIDGQGEDVYEDYSFEGTWNEIRQEAYATDYPIGLPKEEHIVEYGDEILYVDDFEGWGEPRIGTYPEEDSGEIITEFTYPRDLTNDYYAGLHNDIYEDMRHDEPEATKSAKKDLER